MSLLSSKRKKATATNHSSNGVVENQEKKCNILNNITKDSRCFIIKLNFTVNKQQEITILIELHKISSAKK